MRKIWLVSALLVAGLMLAPAAAQAATINFWSGDGNDVLDPGACCPGAITAITPHSVWGDVSDNAGLALGTADWISYANTGIGGFFAPDADSRTVGDETALFQQALNISSNNGLSGTFNLWVLTDDTPTVTVTGPGGPFPLFTAFAGLQIDPCAPGNSGGIVGCTELSMGTPLNGGALTGLLDGLYTLNVYAFQTNSDVFGSQYAGNYSQADVIPEPTSLILLGTGLLGVARARKRLLKARRNG